MAIFISFHKLFIHTTLTIDLIQIGAQSRSADDWCSQAGTSRTYKYLSSIDLYIVLI